MGGSPISYLLVFTYFKSLAKNKFCFFPQKIIEDKEHLNSSSASLHPLPTPLQKYNFSDIASTGVLSFYTLSFRMFFF